MKMTQEKGGGFEQKITDGQTKCSNLHIDEKCSQQTHRHLFSRIIIMQEKCFHPQIQLHVVILPVSK